MPGYITHGIFGLKQSSKNFEQDFMRQSTQYDCVEIDLNSGSWWEEEIDRWIRVTPSCLTFNVRVWDLLCHKRVQRSTCLSVLPKLVADPLRKLPPDRTSFQWDDLSDHLKDCLFSALNSLLQRLKAADRLGLVRFDLSSGSDFKLAPRNRAFLPVCRARLGANAKIVVSLSREWFRSWSLGAGFAVNSGICVVYDLLDIAYQPPNGYPWRRTTGPFLYFAVGHVQSDARRQELCKHIEALRAGAKKPVYIMFDSSVYDQKKPHHEAMLSMMSCTAEEFERKKELSALISTGPRQKKGQQKHQRPHVPPPSRAPANTAAVAGTAAVASTTAPNPAAGKNIKKVKQGKPVAVIDEDLKGDRLEQVKSIGESPDASFTCNCGLLSCSRSEATAKWQLSVSKKTERVAATNLNDACACNMISCSSCMAALLSQPPLADTSSKQSNSTTEKKKIRKRARSDDSDEDWLDGEEARTALTVGVLSDSDDDGGHMSDYDYDEASYTATTVNLDKYYALSMEEREGRFYQAMNEDMSLGNIRHIYTVAMEHIYAHFDINSTAPDLTAEEREYLFWSRHRFALEADKSTDDTLVSSSSRNEPPAHKYVPPPVPGQRKKGRPPKSLTSNLDSAASSKSSNTGSEQAKAPPVGSDQSKASASPWESYCDQFGTSNTSNDTSDTMSKTLTRLKEELKTRQPSSNAGSLALSTAKVRAPIVTPLSGVNGIPISPTRNPVTYTTAATTAGMSSPDSPLPSSGIAVKAPARLVKKGPLFPTSSDASATSSNSATVAAAAAKGKVTAGGNVKAKTAPIGKVPANKPAAADSKARSVAAGNSIGKTAPAGDSGVKTSASTGSAAAGRVMPPLPQLDISSADIVSSAILSGPTVTTMPLQVSSAAVSTVVHSNTRSNTSSSSALAAAKPSAVTRGNPAMPEGTLEKPTQGGAVEKLSAPTTPTPTQGLSTEKTEKVKSPQPLITQFFKAPPRPEPPPPSVEKPEEDDNKPVPLIARYFIRKPKTK
ncbi:uncharacterized protein LOC135808784 [Sycon ciliatum]|uniref:uncharacterized protein LOC135808784 n=1 Tax=Sycon ciliatum TaxID=27933 RepID=UPI0031F67BB7